jgi:hypothetical protein
LCDVLNSCTAETAGSALGLIEIFYFSQFSRLNLLNDDLSDAIMLAYIEVRFGVVKQHDAHLTTIVLVDHTRTDLNVVLCGKT